MSGTALIAEPLTGESFAPFGAVLSLQASGGRPVNEKRGSRRDLPELAHAEAATHPRLALYEIAPSGPEFRVRLFERHPLSAQLFLPLCVRRYLVIVAGRTAEGGPDTRRARAFVALPEQSVIYRADIWHVPLVALDEPGRFLMSVWESGTAQDCIETASAERLSVNILGESA